jgi:hypothetical protein
LAYKLHISPVDLAKLEYGEVLMLEQNLIDFLEKEAEAYGG